MLLSMYWKVNELLHDKDVLYVALAGHDMKARVYAMMDYETCFGRSCETWKFTSRSCTLE